MGPRTYKGLRASADRVNDWSLLYILRETNHYWNAKWKLKRSLHHWDHIIRFVIRACYMQYTYNFLDKDRDTTWNCNIHKCIHL